MMSNTAERPTVRFDMAVLPPELAPAAAHALAATAAVRGRGGPRAGRTDGVRTAGPDAPSFHFPLLPPGTRLGRYLIGACVGVGGVGVVYRAVHTTLNAPVAVKCLRPDVLDHNPDAAARFAREAQLLARIAHPGVVRILDFDDDAALPFAVLEYVDGPSAADAVGRRGPLPAAHGIEIALQVAAGLDAVRRVGAVHRDVKPGNILLAADGTCKLADLGLAAVTRPDEPAVGRAPVGTVGYISPEQATGEPVDHRSDQYSLGCTLYHLVAGRPPFVGRTTMEVVGQHVREAPPPPHEVSPAVPADLSRVILTTLRKSPDDRYPDFASLCDALSGVLRDLPPATPAV